MALTFDASTGFDVTEVPDLREQVAEDWKEAFKETGRPELNTAPETPQGQLIDSLTAALNQKDKELAFLAQQFNPLTASGVWQDALAKIYFITRRPAIRSYAECTLTGMQGTVIDEGAQIRSLYDNTLWTLGETITIPEGGVIKAVFTCESEGAVQAAPGTLGQIVTTVAGWDTVTNEEAATAGQSEEGTSAFEARRYASVAMNSRATCSTVYARVAATDGVIACYVTDNKTGKYKIVDGFSLKPHSLYVAVIGGRDADIAKAIYNSVSAGCDYNGNTTVTVTDENTNAEEDVTFLRPDELQVYVLVTVDDSFTITEGLGQLIRQAVYNNFYGEETAIIASQQVTRVVMFTDLYASRFMPSILNTGISNVLSVHVSFDGVNWTNQVHIPIDAEPVLLLENIQIKTGSGSVVPIPDYHPVTPEGEMTVRGSAPVDYGGGPNDEVITFREMVSRVTGGLTVLPGDNVVEVEV